jgi:pyruvate,water dikinase
VCPSYRERRRRVPIPEDFPVSWLDPADELLAWERDRQHFPGPVPPLEAEVWRAFLGRGLSGAYAAYGVPLRVRVERFNAHLYLAASFDVTGAEMAARCREAESTAGEIAARLGERWTSQWLPEVREHLAFFEGFKLAGSTSSDFRGHLGETFERAGRLGELHFTLSIPTQLALRRYTDLCRELIDDQYPFAALGLLRCDNKTLEADRALALLGALAAEEPVVRAAFERREAADALVELAHAPGAARFLGRLDEFLRRYGRRSTSWSLSVPTWREAPRPVLALIQAVVMNEGRIVSRSVEDLAAERARRLEAIRARLAARSATERGQFERALSAAFQALMLTEDHSFWIDGAAMAEVRRVLLEAGRRLAMAGAIQAQGDVFHLERAEVEAGLLGRADTSRLAAAIARSRSEMERFAVVDPPPRIGIDPGPMPSVLLFDLLRSPVVENAGGCPAPRVLRGNPGSPGVAKGRARVMRGTERHGPVRPGDVLVVESATPAWTAYFGTAVGLVTDVGGALCHCAVVAREYGLPAVVGAGAATNVLRDGELVEVDGTAGTVTRLDRVEATPSGSRGHG